MDASFDLTVFNGKKNLWQPTGMIRRKGLVSGSYLFEILFTWASQENPIHHMGCSVNRKKQFDVQIQQFTIACAQQWSEQPGYIDNVWGGQVVPGIKL